MTFIFAAVSDRAPGETLSRVEVVMIWAEEGGCTQFRNSYKPYTAFSTAHQGPLRKPHKKPELQGKQNGENTIPSLECQRLTSHSHCPKSPPRSSSREPRSSVGRLPRQDGKPFEVRPSSHPVRNPHADIFLGFSRRCKVPTRRRGQYRSSRGRRRSRWQFDAKANE